MVNIGKRLVAAVLQHRNLPAVIHQIAETEALVIRVIAAARFEHQFVISRAVHLQRTLAVGIKNRALIAVTAMADVYAARRLPCRPDFLIFPVLV